MEFRIDFYSKEEVAVCIELTGRDPFPSSENNEIYLFACYTLRQFSNLGNHPVAMVLASLLTTFDRSSANELVQGTYDFPNQAALDSILRINGVRINVDYRILKEQIMPGLPRLVMFRGVGNKAFTGTLPPLKLQPRGFGILGFQVNYYAFHSVINLFRYLAMQHHMDDIYIDHLSRVANYCGKIHVSRGIPLGDQDVLAKAILTEVGIIPLRDSRTNQGTW